MNFIREERIRIINHAISIWTDKHNGINRWFDKKEYSKEYCKSQIEYFNKLLEKELKCQNT